MKHAGIIGLAILVSAAVVVILVAQPATQITFAIPTTTFPPQSANAIHAFIQNRTPATSSELNTTLAKYGPYNVFYEANITWYAHQNSTWYGCLRTVSISSTIFNNYTGIYLNASQTNFQFPVGSINNDGTPADHITHNALTFLSPPLPVAFPASIVSGAYISKYKFIRASITGVCK